MTYQRIARDEMFLDIAGIIAQRGTCPRAQVGAVIVRDGRILSSGYNGAIAGQPHCLDVGCGGGTNFDPAGAAYEKTEYPNGCTRAMHAESNALAYAARVGIATDDATMYCTHAACATCAALMASCGITRSVYRIPYRITAGVKLLEELGIGVDHRGSART